MSKGVLFIRSATLLDAEGCDAVCSLFAETFRNILQFKVLMFSVGREYFDSAVGLILCEGKPGPQDGGNG
jgi:hypothetical protein